MKKKKSHAAGALAMAAILTAQLLAAPLTGVFAAEDNTDSSLAYFVDCGDFDVSTLSGEDKFGIYNTVTDQAYSEDPGTGKKWGIVDTISDPLKNGTSTNALMKNAAYTDNTWPNEWMTGDGVDKTESSRYTKNQFENGMPRVLDYSFEVPNDTYTVELFFADPWGVSSAPTATFEETTVVSDILTMTETKTEVAVADGSLDIHITSESACINLAYIKIYLPGASTGAENETIEETAMTAFSTYQSYPLDKVDVTDAYLTNAEDKDIEYLLSLDADRLLAGFRETAGLDMKGAKRYTGWESSLIGGHTLGHYLTAVAQAVATLPSEDARDAELTERLDYIIASLKECQDATGTGFIFGATIYNKSNIELQFDNVESNKTNITSEAWVPWYTMHKIIAGVIDVYKYTGNETALEVARGLGDWVYNRTSNWSDSTRRTVLNIEYGGMNDCLYELYAVTGEDKYAMAAHSFDDDNLFLAVSKGSKDILNNRHANTTIPKFIGALNRYLTTHGKTINGEVVDASDYLTYARNFFTMVLERHTYVTGDNSEWEHFGADNILDAERTNCNCETCNAYNMLKFAKALYMATGDTSYLNYYENTFYNTILSSQNPENGMTTYFQPMATGYFKVYTTATGSFWCCTGSGMENFTKLGNAIYYSGEDTIVISQYVSSVLTDETKNMKLTMTADIPASDKVTVLVNSLDGSAEIADSLSFRLPDWLAGEAVVTVTTADAASSAASVNYTEHYAVVSGLKNGDTVELTLPMDITVHGLPDNDSVFAFKYGPIVLSAKLGSTNMTTTYTGVSVLIPAAKLIEEEYISNGSDTVSVLSVSVADFMANINENLVKTEGKSEWTLEGTDANLIFVPHYSQHTERYGIYFNYESNSGAFNVSRYLREKEDNRFAAALLDTVQPGYGQYENDSLHNMTELGTGSTGATGEGTSRYANAGGSFVYTMYADPDVDNALELTLKKEDNGKSLQILVGEEIVFNEVLSYNDTEAEYTIRIPVTKDVLAKAATALGDKHPTTGKDAYTVNVTFTSGSEEASARICNYLYMTKAYTTNTGFSLTADAGELTQEGTSYHLVLPETVETLTLTAIPADTFGYVRVNGSVVRDTCTIDMTMSNFLTLEYTVYAEDHETSQTYTVSIEQPVTSRTDMDTTLAYFVNCGDYDVTTLSEGDLFGIYNGVTEQIYSIDPVTGKKWGIVDTISSPLRNGTANNAGMTNTVFTDNTWTFETNAALSDTSAKTATNRYTKNQYENGIARNLNYSFEVPEGLYTVELYFTDPWNCSRNPIVSLEGHQVLKNVAVNKAVTAEVQVTDGVLDLNITSPTATLCLNLCYIKIYLPEDQVVTPTPEPTATPVPTEVPEPTETPAKPSEAPADNNTSGAEDTTAPTETPDTSSENTDTPADADTSADSVSSFPWIIGGAVLLGAIVGVVTYFLKKKKK
ncbi:MAG: glycoside hydrolase family 127 protein [Lachnospiraceae bacterium]|nr:glycoside hydrolase family 127 protein [Lachnospiraceae bacterium]